MEAQVDQGQVLEDSALGEFKDSLGLVLRKTLVLEEGL